MGNFAVKCFKEIMTTTALYFAHRKYCFILFLHPLPPLRNPLPLFFWSRRFLLSSIVPSVHLVKDAIYRGWHILAKLASRAEESCSEKGEWILVRNMHVRCSFALVLLFCAPFALLHRVFSIAALFRRLPFAILSMWSHCNDAMSPLSSLHRLIPCFVPSFRLRWMLLIGCTYGRFIFHRFSRKFFVGTLDQSAEGSFLLDTTACAVSLNSFTISPPFHPSSAFCHSSPLPSNVGFAGNSCLQQTWEFLMLSCLNWSSVHFSPPPYIGPWHSTPPPSTEPIYPLTSALKIRETLLQWHAWYCICLTVIWRESRPPYEHAFHIKQLTCTNMWDYIIKALWISSGSYYYTRSSSRDFD